MTTRRVFGVAAGLACVLLLTVVTAVSIWPRAYALGAAQHKTPPKHQQPTPPPLDQEAVALAEKAFSETWRKLGDSWFIFHQWRSVYYKEYEPTFIQIRGVTFQVRSGALSEADTLNGLRWKGQVEVFVRLRRDYDPAKPPSRQWSDWKDAPDGRLVVANYYTIYTLEKKTGQWTIGAPRRGDNYKLTKPSEEQIKNILTPTTAASTPTAVKVPDPAQAADAERPDIQKTERRATLKPAARALLERADALHDHGDDAGALEAYMEAVKADSNGANLDTISRYAPFQYSIAPPPPPPPGTHRSQVQNLRQQARNEQPVGKTSTLRLAALRQYVQLRPNDSGATMALLMHVDLPEGERRLDAMIKSRPRDPDLYDTRALLLENHERFPEAVVYRSKAAELDPQNPERYYRVGLAAYTAVTKAASLTADQKRALMRQGLTALEHAEALRAEYMESMVYRSLLLRQQAVLEADPGVQQDLIGRADEVRARAIEIAKGRRGSR